MSTASSCESEMHKKKETDGNSNTALIKSMSTAGSGFPETAWIIHCLYIFTNIIALPYIVAYIML